MKRTVPLAMQILLLDVARQRYALPLDRVREILPAMTITRLSGAPLAVEGVIDLRGEVVPVLDLRTRFRLPRKEVGPSDHLVVAETGERTVALRVDRVSGLAEVDASQIDGARVGIAGAEHLAGIARLPDGLVLICDLAAFLSQAESEALAGALAASDGPEDEAP